MTDRSSQILGSPGFLIGLSLLLTNDFVLKEQFHNSFTGKLSDFAGLFVFSLFWMAFFPRQKTFICVSSVVLFVFWKSAYSQSLIDGWNSLPFFGVERTVDYSDLSALLVIPLSYYYSNMSVGGHVPRRLIYPIAIVSLVAFTATSFSQRATFNDQYPFQSSRTELLERMSRLSTHDVNESFWEGNAFEINFDSCNGSASITLEEQAYQTVITLKRMESRCATEVSPAEMRQHFEKEFIDKIREEPVSKSARISSIWSTSGEPDNLP